MNRSNNSQRGNSGTGTIATGWRAGKMAGLLMLALLPLLVLGLYCGGASQTGLWLRILSPDVSITHVRLLIYDATSFSSEPVRKIDVPDPPYSEARKLYPNASEEANQLWVLILAGQTVNESIRVVGIGYRLQEGGEREVARGELSRLVFQPGAILDLQDAEGNSLSLGLEGCQDEDEDGYCPPSDCDDDPATGAQINPGMDEACDGLDNDCDGAADEGCPCNPGDERDCWPQWARDIATVCLASQDPHCPCSQGRQRCENGTWGQCLGLVVPQPEGQSVGEAPDEQGVPCQDNCRDAQGQPVECGVEDFSCYPSCSDDGVDNDCDFYADARDIGCGGCRPGQSRGCYTGPEGTQSNPPCHEGLQFCQDDGTWPAECDGETTPMGWTPENPTGAQEFDHCNGIDDDCDGVTDNVTQAPACSLNQGCCRDARKSCVGGVWVDCGDAEYQQFAHDACFDPVLGEDHQYFAHQEDMSLCDGIDNDCNGTPDDAIDGVCQCQEGWSSVCEDRETGECVPGYWICVDGEVVMDDHCHPPEPEICDNKDNDCDGITDRNEDARQDCIDRLGAIEHARVIDCIAGSCICACDDDWWSLDGDECGGCEYNCTQTPGNVERCDSRDNNCDGTTDAGDPLATPTGLCPNRNQAYVPADPAAACIDGACQYQCNADYGDCNNDLSMPVPYPGGNDSSDGCEVYLPTSDNNCGTCGNDCTDDYPHAVGACNANSCYLDHCQFGWGNCNGSSGDGCEEFLATSHDHCGACDNNCGANAHCTLGMCACDDGWANCNGSWSDGCEINIMSDGNNCGSCGNVCRNDHGSTSCNSGTCVPVCVGLWGDCDSSRENGCETPLNTLSDCGSCGQSCGLAHAAESCSTGSCVITSCSSGWGNCDGIDSNGCENSLDSLSDCGSCGTSCSRAHATASCAGDTCHIASCNEGWGNCNNVDSDGCENSLDSLSDCGSCGTTCSRAHATASCSGDTCHIASCNSGWDDCNNVDSDGCEVDLNNDAANCGSCGNNCGQNAYCSSGSCTCNSGWANCSGGWADGCETQLGTVANCRSCGENCNDGEACTSDSCNTTTGCVNAPVTNGTECGSRYCDGFEYRRQTCQSGTCSGSALVEDCNDGEVCTNDSCSPSSGCSHSNNDGVECGSRYCDGFEYRRQVCSGGTCSSSSLIEDCNDGEVCTNDACSPSSGCSHTDNDGAECGSRYCNGYEYRRQECSGGTCSSSSLVEDCNDGNVCTNDSCSASSGCSHSNNDGVECGLRYCNGLEFRMQTCLGGSCSSDALVENCNDGNVCTDDSCSNTSGCGHSNNSASCDDGVFCNGADTCSGGTCSNHAGDPCAPYGDADCDGGCDEVAGGCSAHEPEGSACSNGSCQLGGSCGCNSGYADCNSNDDDGCECDTGAGNYCNGSSCDPCQVDDHCGGSCVNCTAQTADKKCINRGGGVYSCGCLSDSDCGGSLPNCDNATKICEP